MILEAIHTTINPIITSHVLIGDIDAELPFAVYRAQPQPVRTKKGIEDYIYTVEIGIIDNTPSSVNTYTESVKAAILAMTGTINSTQILEVIHTDESGIYLRYTDKVYINDLEFKVFTKNR